MGFTRYWEIKKSLDLEKFKEFSKACKLVCEAWINTQVSKGNLESELGGWDGTGDPSFEETGICFNGLRGTRDLSHETFSIEIGSLGFNFCKTARKPYDKQVEACLYLAEKFFGDAIEVRSDGDNRDSELISFVKGVVRENKLEFLIEE